MKYNNYATTKIAQRRQEANVIAAERTPEERQDVQQRAERMRAVVQRYHERHQVHGQAHTAAR
jgi:hypothetical protein